MAEGDAFGAKQDITTAVARPSPVNVPVRMPSGGGISGAFRGLATVARGIAKKQSDIDLGGRIAEARALVRGMTNPAEAKLKTQEITDALVKEFGASSFDVIQRGLAKQAPHAATTDQFGNKVITDEQGNILSTTPPDVTTDIEDNLIRGMATVQTDLPRVSEISGPMLSILQQEGSARSNEINEAITGLSTTGDRIESIAHQFMLDTRSGSFTSASDRASGRLRAEQKIMGVFSSALNSLDAPMWKKAFANEGSALNPQNGADLIDAFVNDMLDQMDDSDVFDSMRLDRKKIAEEFELQADVVIQSYNDSRGANLKELKVIEGTKAARIAIAQSQSFLALPKASQNLILMSDDLNSVVKGLDVLRNLPHRIQTAPLSQAPAIQEIYTFATSLIQGGTALKHTLDVGAAPETLTSEDWAAKMANITSIYDPPVSVAPNLLAITELDTVTKFVKDNKEAMIASGVPKDDVTKWEAGLLKRAKTIKANMTEEEVEDVRSWSSIVVDSFTSLFTSDKAARERP